MPIRANFKDFQIRIGQPGAYSPTMKYGRAIGVAAAFNCHIKHAPYSAMNKIKNVVVQTWKDEDGDDVWLPQVTGSKPGEFLPDIKHEAVEYKATFVYYENNEACNANNDIRAFQEAIKGRWLQIFDNYTGIGYDGAYLIDIDDDPKFRRRGHDYVEFTMTFKINGSPISDPFVNMFTINAKCNDDDWGVVTGGGTYKEDEEITLLATANDGYGFVKWSNGSTENPLKIKVTDDLDITAEFEEREEVNLYTGPYEFDVTKPYQYASDADFDIEIIGDEDRERLQISVEDITSNGIYVMVNIGGSKVPIGSIFTPDSKLYVYGQAAGVPWYIGIFYAVNDGSVHHVKGLKIIKK